MPFLNECRETYIQLDMVVPVMELYTYSVVAPEQQCHSHRITKRKRKLIMGYSVGK
jgi:hypothetical protein